MSEIMTKRNLLIIIIGILLIISLAAGGYFLKLKPLHDELESKQAELKMESEQLTIVENKLANTAKETANSSMKLQKQVPVKRLVEQLMLDIEKAEVVSDVEISSITMNSTGTDETIQGTEQENNDNGEKTDSESSKPSKQESTDVLEEETQPQSVTLPSGMKETPFTISGKADTYFEIERFFDSLLGLERKIKLDHLTFEGLKEVTDIEEESNKITFEVIISAYYFPKLEDLRNELPPIDTPEAFDKKNPFNELPSGSNK